MTHADVRARHGLDVRSADYAHIYAMNGFNGGQRYSYRVERLRAGHEDKPDDSKWGPFTCYLALTRIRWRKLSWSTVEECHRTLVSVEKKWGALDRAQVAALTVRQYAGYANTKRLCMSLRGNVNSFMDRPEAKLTLENYLKYRALEKNFCDERGVVYAANLNKRSRHMLTIGEIVKHYSIKNTDNIFLVHSPKWLKDVVDSMYPGIIAGNDVHYTDASESLEIVKTLWEGKQSAGILSAIGHSAELL